MCPGGSVIVSPLGKVIAGPLFGAKGVLIVDIDLNEVSLSKLDFDVVGHYSRDDIFNLNINNQPDVKSEKDIE